MTENTEKRYNSTREWLLAEIEAWLIEIGSVTPEQFGWMSIKDVVLVERLRNGGDITTRKLDTIIRFLRTNRKERSINEKGQKA